LQAFVNNEWAILSLVNGWTEGPGYGQKIVMDCGVRSGFSRVCVSSCKSFYDYVPADPAVFPCNLWALKAAHTSYTHNEIITN